MTTHDEQAGVAWSAWTAVADLERAAPLFACVSGQTHDEVVASLCHLRDLGLMEVRRGRGGRQEFRVRTDSAASVAGGKTVGCILWLLEQAITGKAGRNYWWGAPIYAQAKIAFRRLKRGLSHRGFASCARWPPPPTGGPARSRQRSPTSAS
jgi:hypothetical protein